MKKFAAAVIAGIVAALGAPAHDYWLEPSTFFPEVGKETAVRLWVGDHFDRETERPFQRTSTPRLALIAGSGSTDLLPGAKDGDKPAVRFAIAKPGPAWLVMERKPQTIKLAAAKFHAYLKEEGLEAIIDRRRELGEAEKDGRERYGRSLKCYFQAGEERSELFAKPQGLKLDLVPRTDPAALKVGDKLDVQVLFDGKPLAGAKVFAFSRDGEVVMSQSAVTSKEGIAAFAIERRGGWLVRLVHMRRADGGEVEWESFWGAMSFGVR